MLVAGYDNLHCIMPPKGPFVFDQLLLTMCNANAMGNAIVNAMMVNGNANSINAIQYLRALREFEYIIPDWKQ